MSTLAESRYASGNGPWCALASQARGSMSLSRTPAALIGAREGPISSSATARSSRSTALFGMHKAPVTEERVNASQRLRQ